MLGRAAAVVIPILLLASPALPQCNLSPVFSDQFRSSFLDLAVDGNDLWAATSYGLALYDRTVDPPRLTSSLPIPGATRLIRLANGLGYAASGNSIAVVRKNGRSLQLIRAVDTGAPINDMVVTTLALYVASRNGIAQYDLIDSTNPRLTSATFQTTQTAVTSLVLVGSTLYAADGDSSVELFNITIATAPQRLASIDAGANATSVHANNGKLFVSSAVQTGIFIGPANVGSVPFSLTSLAPISGDAIFAGATDRTLRGVDLAAAGTPVDIFRDEAPASGGTVNRISALVTAGNRLYVAAGDAGIVEYDITNFSAPFPMRSYPISNGSSVISVGTRFYIGRPNGITEFSQSPVPARSWDGSRSDVVQDGDGAKNFLLTSSGSTLTLWTLASTIPQPIGSVTLRAPVTSAVLVDTTAYAMLNDRTVWSADLAQAQPSPQAFTTPDMHPVAIARSDNSIAFADTRDDGTTMIAYYATAAGNPKTVTLPGLATSGLTLSGSTAAVQTFRGVSLIEFNTLIAGVLPQSNTQVDRQLLLSGATLLELTDTSLRIWNVLTQKVTSELMLPGQPLAMHLAPQSTFADVVTSNGVVTIALDRTLRMPASIDTPNGNAFYKRMVSSASHIYLIDGRGVDIYSSAMHYIASIRTTGIVDVAASDTGLFTISSGLGVNAYTPDGVLRSSATISEGADAQPLAISSVNGAVWASIVRGCTSGGCEKKTIVFDPRSGLNQTISMTGAVIDVISNGNRAYAVTDLPAEVRVIDVSDPFHPSTINSKTSDGVSIAYSGGTIYVLGNTLSTYNETNLAKIADLLGPYSTDGTVTFADQHLRINGTCGIVTGRSSSPQLFNLPQWSPANAFASPSPARAIAAQPGTFYILTDHSLEIWSSSPLPKLPRRAPAR